MGAGLPLPSNIENVSSTLSAGITDVDSSADIDDASNFTFPGYYVIDRVDAAGSLKDTSLWEYVKVTNISSNTLTITRAQGGSTGQSHSSGAVIEAVVTGAMFDEWYAVLNPEHDAAGGHVITGTMTVAGMNLASVATIASVAYTTGVGTDLTLSNSFFASGASVSGINQTVPTWYLGVLPSLATTGLGRAVPMPRVGTWKYATVSLDANISSATVFFDINKNSTSIFDTIGRPLIASGTFVSTASIKTKNFAQGDQFNVDYDVIDLGGNQVGATVQLVSE